MAHLKLVRHPRKEGYWLVRGVHERWEELTSLDSGERVIFVGSQELKNMPKGIWSDEDIAGRPEFTQFVRSNIATKSRTPAEEVIATD